LSPEKKWITKIKSPSSTKQSSETAKTWTPVFKEIRRLSLNFLRKKALADLKKVLLRP